MCTAITYKTKDHYFGRNLDLDYSYEETVTVTPRHYPFAFRRMGTLTSHYAIIGMAYVVEDYPLYYDGINEKGLGMAGLNFPGNACYGKELPEKDNISPFEFIPWILGKCATVAEARALLARINLVELPFREDMPLAPLHWMLADRRETITVEAMADGLKIYDNPAGVLTNNPPFEMQMFHLNHYMSLSTEAPVNHFSDQLTFDTYCLGLGAMGLPGDLSSMSRFVKAAFTRLNSVSGDTESESISQFFHILGSVEQQRGCVRTAKDRYEVTAYSSCCNTDKGIYYYITYENRQIIGVDMHREDLEGSRLISYPLVLGQQIRMQN